MKPANIAVYITYRKNRVYTNMLGIHLFCIFTIKTNRLSLRSRP